MRTSSASVIIAFTATALVATSVQAQSPAQNQSSTKWLTEPVTEAYPAVSPDGRTVVFQSKRLGHVALFMADADGKNLRLFLDPKTDPASANWSPDGRRITFAGTVDDNSEVFVVDADGKNLRRLTTSKSDDSHPVWSHDGSRILFSSNRHTPDMSLPFGRQHHDTFSMKPDGSDLRQVTNCRAVCTFPAPSPDGRFLAYRKLLASPGMRWDQTVMVLDSEVMVADIDGANERALAPSPAFDGWPAWSPDGQWIAFTSNRAGQVSTGQVFLVRPDGKDLRQLTSGDFSNTTPRWSPDSKRIYTYRHKEFADHEIGSVGVTEITPPPV